jgi:hypothetical protein
VIDIERRAGVEDALMEDALPEEVLDGSTNEVSEVNDVDEEGLDGQGNVIEDGDTLEGIEEPAPLAAVPDANPNVDNTGPDGTQGPSGAAQGAQPSAGAVSRYSLGYLHQEPIHSSHCCAPVGLYEGGSSSLFL